MKLKLKELSNKLSFVRPADTQQNPYNRTCLVISDIVKTVVLYTEDFKSSFVYYYGEPKVFLDDLYSGSDSLDILVIGDSNVHFGSRDGGWMYGWGWNLEEAAGITCYATPIYLGLTRTLFGANGAPGHAFYVYTSTNTVYKGSMFWLTGETNPYSTTVSGFTLNPEYPPGFHYRPGNSTVLNIWLGSHQGDTYANWVNERWNCGLTLNGKFAGSTLPPYGINNSYGFGWQPFNAYADWAYLKPGITFNYGGFRNIQIFNKSSIAAGISYPSQLTPDGKISGNTYDGSPITNERYYGRFDLNSALEYRVVHVQFPYSGGLTGSIRLGARLYPDIAANDSSSTLLHGPTQLPYTKDVSTRSLDADYHIVTDVLGISAGTGRTQMEFGWGGYFWNRPNYTNRINEYNAGPAAILMNSVVRKNTKGYGLNSFHAKSGADSMNIAKSILAAPKETYKLYFKELSDRQISAGGSGRVLIFMNFGINDTNTFTDFSDAVDLIMDYLVDAWQTAGLPKNKLAFIVTPTFDTNAKSWTSSPTYGAGGYTLAPDGMWYQGVLKGITAKYKNTILLNTNQWGIGSRPYLEQEKAYIFDNSYSNEYSSYTNNDTYAFRTQGSGFPVGYNGPYHMYSVGRSQNDPHLAQGSPLGLTGEGGYAKVIRGIIYGVTSGTNL